MILNLFMITFRFDKYLANGEITRLLHPFSLLIANSVHTMDTLRSAK